MSKHSTSATEPRDPAAEAKRKEEQRMRTEAEQASAKKVSETLDLMRKLDLAKVALTREKRKAGKDFDAKEVRVAEDAVDSAQHALNVKERELTVRERGTVHQMFNRQRAFEEIEATKNMVHSRVGKVVGVIPHTIGTISGPVARTARESVAGVLDVIGGVAGGVVKGVKKIGQHILSE